MPELKTQNEKKLVGVVLIVLIPLYISFFYQHPDVFHSLVKSPLWESISLGLSPLFLMTVLVVLLSNTLNGDTKACIVFCRRQDPLPAGRANIYMQRDARIDCDDLPSEVLALMDDSLNSRQRNSLWYNQIFKMVDDTPAVKNTHRMFLLLRDATPLVYLFLIVISATDIVCRYFYEFPIMTWPGYAAMALYAVIVHWSAAQAGRRMVTGAIANFTSQKIKES